MSAQSNVTCPKCHGNLCLVLAQEPSKPRGPITDMEVLAHAKNICPIPLTEEIIAKFTVADGGTFWKLKSPYWGGDENGKRNFAIFTDGIKQLGGEWFSDKANRQYYYKIPKGT